MLAAELHAHTYYSKGTKIRVEGLHSPEQMVKAASKLSLNILAITDHNVFRGALEAEKVAEKYGVFVLKGEEITLAGDKHLLALGIEEKIRSGISLHEAIDYIHEQGGIAVAPHPFDIDNKGLGLKSKFCDAIEVFNALNKDKLSNLKAKRYAAKEKLPITAGSDAHCIKMLGYGITLIDAEPDTDSILKAILKGKTELLTSYVPVSTIKEWSLQRILYSYPQILEYIYENYRGAKKFISEKLLSLVLRWPGRVDYLFSGLAYLGLFGACLYSVVKTPFRK